MEQIPITKLKVISSMFSYGAKQNLEPRPTELKGLLRNTYRIANPHLKSADLYKNEVGLFGGQKKNGDIIASPLRIQMKVNNDNLENICKYKPGTEFSVNFQIYDPQHKLYSSSILKNKKVIDWYTDLILLSLIIGGIGRGSRRGRGCMTTDELEKISINDLPNEVKRLLNNVCEKPLYKLNKQKEIVLSNKNGIDDRRSYINKIRFEKILNENFDKIIKYSSGIGSIAKIKNGKVQVYTVLSGKKRQ